MRLLKLLSAAAEEHKLFRRLTLVWAAWLITWVTFRVFGRPYEVTGHTATALGIIVGILATAIGFYKWSRHTEDRHDDKG